MLDLHEVVVSSVVGMRHNHFHLVGQLIGEGHIPAGVDLVQLPLADVRHSVLAHVVLVLRAQTSGPPAGEWRWINRRFLLYLYELGVICNNWGCHL